MKALIWILLVSAAMLYALHHYTNAKRKTSSFEIADGSVRAGTLNESMSLEGLKETIIFRDLAW
jgi:hypothetical protein